MHAEFFIDLKKIATYCAIKKRKNTSEENTAYHSDYIMTN